MNTVGKITFNFSMQNETFARDLYARWDSFFAANFERIADEVLEQWRVENGEWRMKDKVLEIEKLELDLGTLLEEELDEKFPLRLREKLEEALIQWRVENGDSKVESGEWRMESEKTFSTLHFQLSTLCNFLLHGTLPWHASEEDRDIHKLFLKVLQNNGNEFKQFLLTYGHYASLQQRLVYQLSNPELEQGVELLQPSQKAFIVGYVRLLQSKFNQINQAEIRETDHRNAVWLVVYAYLLNNRASFFDRKNFIIQTLLRLASRYNTSYEHLLKIITDDLAEYSKQFPIPIELSVILQELRKKLSENQWKKSSFNAADFFKLIYSSVSKNTAEITTDARESLIQIVAEASSCRLFLQQLKEEEIYHLVKVVIPAESGFVIDTAKSLDKMANNESKSTLNSQSSLRGTKQSTLNSLQGKAGGEFRLLKWQIIFSLLFENKGVSFNRKYFVENVLKQIAAHYNMEWATVLTYICQDKDVLNLFDADVRKIILSLMENGEWKVENEGENRQNQNKETTFSSFSAFHSLLLIEEFLNTKLPTNEVQFVFGYAEQLDKAKERDLLEGKANGGFQELKWRFIFIVLDKMPKNSFNRSYFVKQTLHQLSAHYNIAYFDLLHFFQNQEIAIHLSFELQQTLNQLLVEEITQWTQWALQSKNEKDKLKLVAVLSPRSLPFIKSYNNVLEKYHSAEKLSGDFQTLKWRIIFEVLLESQHVAFNKKQFVHQTLRKISAHYNLSFVEFLAWFVRADNLLINKTEFKEIHAIINELHQEESKPKIKPVDSIGQKILPKPGSEKERLLLEELSAHSDFLVYAADMLKILANLKKFMASTLKIPFEYERILILLLRMARNYRALSRVQILEQILAEVSKQLTAQQQKSFYQNIEKWCTSKKIQRIIYQQINSKIMKKENSKIEDWKLENEETTSDINELNIKEVNALSILEAQLSTEKESLSTLNSQLSTNYINNAGVVLLYPYLSRLFSMLELTETSKFKNEEAQIRATYFIQFLVFGRTDFPEPDLWFNKLLVGFLPENPIPKNIELSQHEKEICESLLKGVLQNWQKLKNTSIAGLQQGFLQRNGKLEETDDRYQLTVEEKAYDILLDSCPWNFRTIKFPWMKKMIQVKWR